ncbi:Bug family tripartite tricarboxylate transporter substrate binding protein [Cupriavidus necator]|uniref:Bug family tripartite tricarboxylate transporter substrate binding protein n=1 Tax=Cupriavidus necator TaxID=106590 RepID=UPI00068DE4B9|nr:tripartite tricarboxylate transporter substrate binding protein [Cupriavidus necator]
MNFAKSALVALLSAFTAMTSASAADYPEKPVKVLVGFPAGQATDIIARRLAQHLSTALGQSFYVENKPGAGAGLAADEAARARPDGYTLLATSSGPMAVNGWIYRNQRYDSVRDFYPLALIGIFPLVMVVNSNSQFKNVTDLVNYAKRHPGAVNYASGGNGVTNHLVMEMFKRRAGINLSHVPYKGGVPAMADVVGGQVEVMFETVSIAGPLIRSGKLRPLAVASEGRVSTLPNVPTIAESGFPGFRGDAWVGIVAPKSVPRPIADKLSTEIVRISKTSEWINGMAEIGVIPKTMVPAEFNHFLRSEVALWGEAVKAANVNMD